MNLESKQDRETEPMAAFIAPLAGIGTFVLLMLIIFSAFPNDKTALPLLSFAAAAAGIYVGRVCYSNSRSVKHEPSSIATDKPEDSIPSKLWALGLAIQIFAYLALCILLGSNLRIVPRQYGQILWVGFNCLVFLSMLVSLGAIFRIHRDTKNQIVHLFWSISLFAILYASFVCAATWLADPNTIPGKIGW